jgi:hypothetical protein
METARHPQRGGAPPMGVSCHRAARRFEGRESAAGDLPCFYVPAAEPRLNALVRKRSYAS